MSGLLICQVSEGKKIYHFHPVPTWQVYHFHPVPTWQVG